jgi:hypothetical protein
MRDCEFRFDVLPGVPPVGASGGGDIVVMCVLSKLVLVGRFMLAISLWVLRWADGRVAGLLGLIASNDGVYPRYHAVGDDGDIPEFSSEKVSVNIGFGLCMLPSEPRLRRGDEMP